MVKDLKLMYIEQDTDTPILIFKYKDKFFVAKKNYWNGEEIQSWVDDPNNIILLPYADSIFSANPYSEFVLATSKDYEAQIDILRHVEGKVAENEQAIEQKLEEIEKEY